MNDESTVITAAVASILDAWVDTTGGDPETTEDIADAIVRTVQSLTITPDLPECVHDDKVLANGEWFEAGWAIEAYIKRNAL